MKSSCLIIKRVKISFTSTSNLPYISYSFTHHNNHTFARANMAPSKRNRSATLAKSPPDSPIRPITKRPRQKTPESSVSITLPLPLRPIKLITSTPTAFNSSQIDESESENDMQARVINESENEEESESEEEDDITCNNEYLDQDLNELGPDRLDREDIDESDAENELPEEFKRSKFFI